MRNLNIRKRLGLLLALPLATLGIVAVAHAAVTFGPSRPTFTWAHPATYITFNSITDNPVVGDERQFLKTRDLTLPTTAYSTQTTVTDGEDVVMEVYFHNNAASNLNLTATGTTVKFALPSGSATTMTPTAYITAANSSPGQVFATADLTSSTPFSLSYEPGTAKLYTNFVNGIPVSDNVVAGGTLICSHGPDGLVPGCAQFSGYVTIRVKVHMVTPPVHKHVVKPVTKTTALPNTGPGDVFELFAGTSAAGTAGHFALSAIRRRRL